MTVALTGCGEGAGRPADADAGASDVGTSDATTPDAGPADAELPAVEVGYVHITAGTFMMGSPDLEPERTSDEVQHEVTLTRSFWIKATEVTQGEWKALSGGVNPSCFQSPSDTYPSCSTSDDNDDAPVEQVTWWSALEFMNALSAAHELTPCYTLPPDCFGSWAAGTRSCVGEPTPSAATIYECTGFRLPTSAEWEYAARAGTTGPYGAPDAVLDELGWFADNAGDRTHPVATKSPNAWGLYDVFGNVFELTHDRASLTGYSGAPARDPEGAESGSERIARNCAWGSPASMCRVASFSRSSAVVPDFGVGFRPVRTASSTR